MARSGHATIVARAPSATPTTFSDIAELNNVTLPELMRKDFDATTQNLNIDTFVAGVLRRNPVTLNLNFLSDNATQDHLTGLINAMVTEPPPLDGYKFYQTSSGLVWIASGYVTSIKPTAPVDGLMSAAVTLRLSGKMSINGVSIG